MKGTCSSSSTNAAALIAPWHDAHVLTMAYLVKESLTATPRKCSIEGIRSDFEQKLLNGSDLVSEEKQDFWYSVNELLEVAPVSRFFFACRKCRGMISARIIDLGLEIKCARCQAQTSVPDVKARQNAVMDRHLLKEANHTLLAGVALFILGAGTTFASYMDALSRGNTSYYIFWGLAIIGAGMMLTGYSKRRQFYKKYPPANKKGC
jgi:hypothetical protein